MKIFVCCSRMMLLADEVTSGTSSIQPFHSSYACHDAMAVLEFPRLLRDDDKYNGIAGLVSDGAALGPNVPGGKRSTITFARVRDGF